LIARSGGCGGTVRHQASRKPIICTGLLPTSCSTGSISSPASFRQALVLGCADGGLADALRGRGLALTAADPGQLFASAGGAVQCDEDRLPFADGSFDLVMSVGLLDSVNDLPGALTLIRRALRPDGLFLAAFAGAGSLPSPAQRDECRGCAKRGLRLRVSTRKSIFGPQATS
jgi:SAM-dependent methyltransferase